MSNHELSNLLLLNEMVLVLDALSSSTSTSTATAEYEYEKQGKTSIDTPKHPNSATSKPAGRRGAGGGEGGRAIRYLPTGSEARSTGKEARSTGKE